MFLVLDQYCHTNHEASQIGCITLDNASNCDTMMSDLAALLKAEGVPFDAEGNRLR